MEQWESKGRKREWYPFHHREGKTCTSIKRKQKWKVRKEADNSSQLSPLSVLQMPLGNAGKSAT